MVLIIKNVIKIIVDPIILKLSTSIDAVTSPIRPPEPLSKLFIEWILSNEHSETIKKIYPRYLTVPDSCVLSLTLLYVTIAINTNNSGIINAALPKRKYKVSLKWEPNIPPKFWTSVDDEFIQLLSFSWYVVKVK